MMPPYLTTLLPWLYLLPMIGGLWASLRYRRLSAYMPMLTSGFAVAAFTSFVSRFYLMSMLHYFPVTYSVLSLFSIAAWGMIAAGIALVLRDFEQKQSFLALLPQSEWHANVNTPGAYQGANGAVQSSAFAPAPSSASAPTVAPNVNATANAAGSAAFTPQTEVSEAVVPLGASHS